MKDFGSLFFERGLDLVLELSCLEGGIIEGIMRHSLGAEVIDLKEIRTRTGSIEEKMKQTISQKALLVPKELGGAIIVCSEEPGILSENQNRCEMQIRSIPRSVKFHGRKFQMSGMMFIESAVAKAERKVRSRAAKEEAVEIVWAKNLERKVSLLNKIEIGGEERFATICCDGLVKIQDEKTKFFAIPLAIFFKPVQPD